MDLNFLDQNIRLVYGVHEIYLVVVFVGKIFDYFGVLGCLNVLSVLDFLNDLGWNLTWVVGVWGVDWMGAWINKVKKEVCPKSGNRFKFFSFLDSNNRSDSF